MKPAPSKQPTSDLDPRAKRLAGWVKLTAVIYRITLVIGLLLFAASAVLIFFTRRTHLWVVTIPIGLIVFSVLLAHVEYRLYRRMHHPQYQDSIQDE